MSLIDVHDLSFSYDNSHDLIFDHVSFMIDTDWKLGFTGRNGRGKTTFLNLLMGKYEYSGLITATVSFDYFPFDIGEEQMKGNALDVIKSFIGPYKQMEDEMETLLKENTDASMETYGELLNRFMAMDGYTIEEMIVKELSLLDFPLEALASSFDTLSKGEKTKGMLASLFLKKNAFLLIDEPTNHLDLEGRLLVSQYLKKKKGFILVSHDRNFLDESIDHILVLNKTNIEVQKGNFSTWQQNKELQDNFELNQNVKLKNEITKLTKATKRTASWSDQIESSKIGSHAPDRGFIGHKAAKMMKRSKSTQRRQEDALAEKQKLLKNIESSEDLKLNILKHHSPIYVKAQDVSIYYGTREIFSHLSFEVNPKDRVSIRGKNGSGKSSVIKLLLGEEIAHEGSFYIPPGLQISYIPQDTHFLKGNLKQYCLANDIDETLFKTILRKLDFSREQFDKELDFYSQGQKKKVLIAKSLCEKAHLLIWDEPLNYIDVISRIQIETLLKQYEPTMIFVEHDKTFNENIATKTVYL